MLRTGFVKACALRATSAVIQLPEAVWGVGAMALEKRDVRETGQSIYLTRILPKLPEGDKGKMVVIDVDSGDYEVDADQAAALKRLLARRPDARAWTEEFQDPRVFRMGWRGTYGRLSFDDEATAFINRLNSDISDD